MGAIKKQFYKAAFKYSGGSILAAAFLASSPADAANSCANPPKTTATFAIDVESGHVIMSENADAEAAPASTLKLLPFLAVYEAEKEGLLNFSDTITISNQARRDASGNRISGFSTLTIEEALRAAAVYSLNDLAEQLEIEAVKAHGIEPTADNRRTFRNALAQKAGMTNSYFYSGSGMPVYGRDADGIRRDRNRTTVRDMVQLMMYIHSNHPDMEETLGLSETTVRGQTFRTTNNSLRSGEVRNARLIGKTGWTCDARSAFNGMILSEQGNVAFATVGNANGWERHLKIMDVYEKGQSYYAHKAELERIEAMRPPPAALPDTILPPGLYEPVLPDGVAVSYDKMAIDHLHNY